MGVVTPEGMNQDKNDNSPMVPQSARTWSFKNTTIAAQTYMLAARAFGLDTCPMEGFDERKLREVLKFNERYAVPLVVATGYASDPEPAIQSARLPFRDMVYEGTFGNPYE